MCKLQGKACDSEVSGQCCSRSQQHSGGMERRPVGCSTRLSRAQSAERSRKSHQDVAHFPGRSVVLGPVRVCWLFVACPACPACATDCGSALKDPNLGMPQSPRHAREAGHPQVALRWVGNLLGMEGAGADTTYQEHRTRLEDHPQRRKGISGYKDQS